MSKFISSILFLIAIVNHSWSQDLLGFENTSHNDRSDFHNAEPKALEAAKFLLNTPINEPTSNRENAMKYMIMWMEGTPDYTFYIDNNIGSFTRSNNTLLVVYMACLTKNSLENPNLANNRDELKYMSVDMYMDYCLNPSNNVKSYKQLERLVKVRDKGKLKDYIKE
jgi:hypothetical protein